MNKLRFAAMLGKTIGYVSFALTQTLRFTGKAARKVSEAVQNKAQFNIVVIDKNGVVIKEYSKVTQAKVNEVMTAMHHLHDGYKVTIEDDYVTINEPSEKQMG